MFFLNNNQRSLGMTPCVEFCRRKTGTKANERKIFKLDARFGLMSFLCGPDLGENIEN